MKDEHLYWFIYDGCSRIKQFCTPIKRIFSCTGNLILVREFSICLLWWHLTLQHKLCWAGIATFTTFSHGRVGGWTETNNPQNAALITPAVAFLPAKNQQQITITSFPTKGKRCISAKQVESGWKSVRSKALLPDWKPRPAEKSFLMASMSQETTDAGKRSDMQ